MSAKSALLLSLFSLGLVSACFSPTPPPNSMPTPQDSLATSSPFPGELLEAELLKAGIESKAETESPSFRSLSPDQRWAFVQRYRSREVRFKGKKSYASQYLPSQYQVLDLANKRLIPWPEAEVNLYSSVPLWLQDGRVVYASEAKPSQLIAWNPDTNTKTPLYRPAAKNEYFSPVQQIGDTLYAKAQGYPQNQRILKINLKTQAVEEIPMPYQNFYENMTFQVSADESSYLFYLSKGIQNREKYPFHVATTSAPIFDPIQMDAKTQKTEPLWTELDSQYPEIQFSQAGDLFLSRNSNTVKVVDLKTRAMILSAPGQEGLWLDADRVLVLENGYNTPSQIRLHSLSQRKILSSLKLPQNVSSWRLQGNTLYLISYSDQGLQLTSVNLDGDNLSQNPQLLRSLPKEGNLEFISPKGKGPNLLLSENNGKGPGAQNRILSLKSNSLTDIYSELAWRASEFAYPSQDQGWGYTTYGD
ncbi:MAG: hypothetical protein AB7I41_19230 [Candidatus Sericytochromatia bacterium]